jgi:malate dehydrogenase (quinone)
MLSVARDNMDLTRYLVSEAFKSHKERVGTLREFYADAAENQWELAAAGKRVQIIKGCDTKGGRLEFGTEIVTSKDCTLATLLGASPGASVSVQAMLEVIDRCFKQRAKAAAWKHKLKEMIPSYGESLDENVELLHEVRKRTLDTLKLNHEPGK